MTTPGVNASLPSTYSPYVKWLHDNPNVQKSALAALAALGIHNLKEGIQNFSLYQTTLGAILTGSAYGINNILPAFIPPTHNPSNKAFQEGSCRGVDLFYQGNLPLLKIHKTVNPFDAGYARGFLMAPQIKHMQAKNDLAFFTLRRLPREIHALLDHMKTIIPANFIEEMKGLAAGYNAKRETWTYLKGNALTLEDLIYFHLLPDALHMDFKEANNWALRNNDLGCTTVVDGNTETGPVALHTVDWFPLDTYGTYSFIELRETVDDIRYAGQSFPLLIGAITAMNQYGLCAALHVARGLTKYPDKIPAVFYIRQLIETCSSVKQAEWFWNEYSPLGPFNLTLLDKENAASIHFYQREDNSHNVRWWEEKELITLNFVYGEKGETNPTQTNSPQRKEEIETYYDTLIDTGEYDNRTPHERLMDISLGKEVNNHRTTTYAYFDPKNLTFKTAADNGYACDQPLLDVPTADWFS